MSLYTQVRAFRSQIPGWQAMKPLREMGRSVYVASLKMRFGKEYPLLLGGKFPVRLRPEFFYCEHFGDRHNKGWWSCLQSLRGEQIFLDIGAHIGLYSLPASQVMDGRIYAFEPSDKNQQVLREHLKMNQVSNVEVIGSLVGETSSESIEFYEDQEVSALNSQVMTDRMKSSGRFETRLKIQISIDDFCSEREIRPDVIKIDVEGAEAGVLRGAVETLKASHPLVYLSVHPGRMERMGEDPKALLSLLASCGYGLYEMNLTPAKTLRSDEYLAIKEVR